MLYGDSANVGVTCKNYDMFGTYSVIYDIFSYLRLPGVLVPNSEEDMDFL